jgi:hypothetical protein
MRQLEEALVGALEGAIVAEVVVVDYLKAVVLTVEVVEAALQKAEVVGDVSPWWRYVD